MAGRFDRIMLAQDACTSRTVRRLEDAEFRAFIAALCLAGQSPVRGSLLISESECCTASDIADEAGVDVQVVESTIEKLVRCGTLSEGGRAGCLFFTGWSKFNPAPRPSESREATRERKRAQRAREAQAKLRAVPPAAGGSL